MIEIGNKIKKLRIENSITQEELGKVLKVSTQAVSKWENGGLPDIELIPDIAKYFNVTIDYLFDVPNNDYKNIEQKVCNYITSLDSENDKLYKIYELGYLSSIATYSDCNINDYDYKKIMEKDDDFYSLLNLENGFAFTSLNKELPYFLVFPKPKDRLYNDVIKYKKEQIQFFKEMASEDFYNVLVYINSRVNKSFTLELIEKELKIDRERANEIITKLLNYNILRLIELELNDDVIKTYSLCDSPLIVSMLAMVNTIIKKPNCFYHHVNNHNGKYFSRLEKSND